MCVHLWTKVNPFSHCVYTFGPKSIHSRNVCTLMDQSQSILALCVHFWTKVNPFSQCVYTYGPKSIHSRTVCTLLDQSQSILAMCVHLWTISVHTLREWIDFGP